MPAPVPKISARVVDLVLETVVEQSSSRAVVWRSMAFLYVCAGVIGLGVIILSDDIHANEGLIAGVASVALLGGIVLMAVGRHLPSALTAAALSAGLVLVSVAVIASGHADSPYVLFYIWIGMEAWFFLSAANALYLTLATITLSAGVMTYTGGADVDAWWLAITGSLLVMSALAATLDARSKRLIGRLGETAVRDALTGLLNRRGYQQRLDQELARARRHGLPLSIVLGDIDFFKDLNDQFGHREGDEMLRRFAKVCSAQLRDTDFVSRVGGEEFAIVLPDTDEGGAILAAERVRRAVHGRLKTPAGTPISASFGVATFPKHGSDAEVLLDHADQAMYAAKAMGRNSTIAFAKDLPRGRHDGPRPQQMHAVLLLAETLDMRDAGTRAHSETVAGLCEQTATELGLPCSRVREIRLVGLLHDVGKIGVPDHVLRKAGDLSPCEWAEMRKHPEVGARIVAGAGLDEIAQWVLAHHERPDGKGYPYGLSGDEIPLEARILSVADAYEAMTADRPYRAAPGEAYAREQLRAGAGTQFDADVVAAFLSAVPAPEQAPAA